MYIFLTLIFVVTQLRFTHGDTFHTLIHFHCYIALTCKGISHYPFFFSLLSYVSFLFPVCYCYKQYCYIQCYTMLLYKSIRVSLDQRSANCFHNGPVSKRFRLCQPYGQYHNYSTLLLCGSPQAIHKWVCVWGGANKSLSTWTGSWQDLARGPHYARGCCRENDKWDNWNVLYVHLQNNKILSNWDPRATSNV